MNKKYAENTSQVLGADSLEATNKIILEANLKKIPSNDKPSFGSKVAHGLKYSGIGFIHSVGWMLLSHLIIPQFWQSPREPANFPFLILTMIFMWPFFLPSFISGILNPSQDFGYAGFGTLLAPFIFYFPIGFFFGNKIDAFFRKLFSRNKP